MKTLLIRPPFSYRGFSFQNGPAIGIPIGITYLASELEGAGYEVELFDSLVDYSLEKPFFRDNGGYIHFGAPISQIVQRIRDVKPEIVGISSPFTSQIKNTLKVAEAIKQLDRHVVVVVGGPHASIAPESILHNSNYVDYVVIGEGERTMVELIYTLSHEKGLKGVSGIAYRENNRVVINPPRQFIKNIDQISLPAYHLLDMEKYFKINKIGFTSRVGYEYPGAERAISIITSRGCPYRCIFCSVHGAMGRQWRYHSVDYIINHIKMLVKNYNIKHIHFEDDNMTFRKERFVNLLNEIISQGFNITWDTPNGVRADTLDEVILKKCIQAGCTYLVLGVESGSQRVLDEVIGKKLKLKVPLEVARICHKIGLDLGAFFIIGLPGETKTDIRMTTDYAMMLKRRYNVQLHFHFAMPLPGTAMYKTCVEKGYLVKELDLENYLDIIDAGFDEPLVETEEFSIRELKHFRKSFYTRHLVLIILQLTKFIIRHPRITLRVVREYLGKAMMRHSNIKFTIRDMYLKGFMFENCLKRNIRGKMLVK